MTAPDLVEVCQGVYRREEGAVQPSSSLQNEIGHLFGYISLAGGRLDILQDPAAVAFAHEFPTENAVLSQVHVCSENASIRTVHLLTRKVLLQWTLTCLVVLQSNKSVRREGSGKDRNEAKGTLERLVEDVAHLVFEVLGGDCKH